MVTDPPRGDVKELLHPVVSEPALLSQEPDALGAPTRLVEVGFHVITCWMYDVKGQFC